VTTIKWEAQVENPFLLSSAEPVLRMAAILQTYERRTVRRQIAFTRLAKTTRMMSCMYHHRIERRVGRCHKRNG
jgi:hypothetical protein